MAKQDDYIRITLRMPPTLHRALALAAGEKSLNAEIIERLADSIYSQAGLSKKKSDGSLDEPPLLDDVAEKIYIP